MSRQTLSPDFLAFIPHAIEPDWDNVWAPRLAGFPVNIFYAARIEGVGLAQATYVFDPSTFVQDERCKEMRYRPTVESVFSVIVVLHREGWIETLKYRESDLICEACGPDFRTAMIHATRCGLTLDEPRTCVENSTTEPGRIGETLNLRLGHWASSPEDTSIR